MLDLSARQVLVGMPHRTIILQLLLQVLRSMASPPIKPLDGPGGYLRWKESMLLRFHTLRVAHVLSKDPPSGDGASEEAAEKWARDDVICRGHILAALSDRLLPDYARHATAKALWDAVARTYDVETRRVWEDKFKGFSFDAGGHFLEQLAHAEALGAAAELSDGTVACLLAPKLPEVVGTGVALRVGSDKEGMSLVWDIARRVVSRIEPERLWSTSDSEYGVQDQEHAEEKVCWTCGKPGHIARNCGVAGHNKAIAMKGRRRA